MVRFVLILFFSLSIFNQGKAWQDVYPSEFTVAQDGSGDFKTIQEAVNAVRDHSEQRVYIFIKNGIYHEKLVVPSSKRYVTFIGESTDKTIISNGDYSGKEYPGTDSTGNTKFTTYTSYTVLVQGNDFSAENLTIENSAGPVGQAVALHVEADRAAFKNCRFLGHQDTLYVSKAGVRSFFLDCYIAGTTDFIFGASTAYFERCTIVSLKNSYITAASTTDKDKYGLVFYNCRLIAGDSTVHKVYLGRPWRPYAKTVFINTEMDAHITGPGWHNWGKPSNEVTAFYAEYKSFGPGAQNVSERVKWSRQLKKSEARDFQKIKVLNGWEPVFHTGK